MNSISRDISPPPRSSKRKRTREAVSHEVQYEGDAVTVYSFNVNSCQPFLQPSISSYFHQPRISEGSHSVERTSLRQLLAKYDWPTLLMLQEVKIAPDDLSTQRAVENAVKRQRGEPKYAPEYEAHLCLPSDRYNARGFGGKVYGVCAVIRSDYSASCVERVRPVKWDREGRFLIVETRASDHMPKLAFINIYAVNGTQNPYRDSDTGLVTGTRHDRKLQVHAELQRECRQLEANGFAVVIAGDINIARTALDGHPKLRTSPYQHCINRADFEAKFFSGLANDRESDVSLPEQGLRSIPDRTDGDDPRSLNMIDTFRHLHPNKQGYTYYPRTRRFGDSCDRVDMVIISQVLKKYLVEAGMHETACDRATSDHVPLYAKFRFQSTPDR